MSRQRRVAVGRTSEPRLKCRAADGRMGTVMRDELLELILAYQLDVAWANTQLRRLCPGEPWPLRAWRKGRLPQKGYVDVAKTISYCFHGVGCCVEFGTKTIDFDYGLEGRCDGFDAWRLSIYADSLAGYESFRDHHILHLELMESVFAGEFIRLPGIFTDHLLYLPSWG